MFRNDRGDVPDLFGGAGWRTSDWRLVEQGERWGFVLIVSSLLPWDVYTRGKAKGERVSLLYMRPARRFSSA